MLCVEWGKFGGEEYLRFCRRYELTAKLRDMRPGKNMVVA
jgi:hypothetical protein